MQQFKAIRLSVYFTWSVKPQPRTFLQSLVRPLCDILKMFCPDLKLLLSIWLEVISVSSPPYLHVYQLCKVLMWSLPQFLCFHGYWHSVPNISRHFPFQRAVQTLGSSLVFLWLRMSIWFDHNVLTMCFSLFSNAQFSDLRINEAGWYKQQSEPWIICIWPVSSKQGRLYFQHLGATATPELAVHQQAV